ncbi:selection and upkeep of intraepithelial T-cells protein 8-like isoform X1 [Cervus elaphus]|uniref:selection and upkeep of intraepithelial T-cells protein 8-like isoform X1 n=1 Tax=Cervus elaphus TaxID=9860 RepID=UPI001CC29A12|nr:selection and upkeep of intraepithelial T-cells protein 8-like isoform X1 [Cervus elaphus]XP_043733402.1 selection and upkeep of intraepithelial T-cells protein 8-like isoform X1 [Cervus elaphus]
MMKLKSSSFSGSCVSFLLLQVMTSTSENWTVTIPTRHLVATVGGHAELSCQLSPPRSAEHMEVRWFRGDNSKLIHLYRDGHEVNGEAAPEYVNRTEFVKEAIREGKVTLRLRNISVSDAGSYQCSFKGSGINDVASMNLSIAALGLETQTHVQAPGTKGLMVDCNSGGWFPKPQMECRDSRGERLPHSSKSYSQDGARLFHVKMTLVLRNQSWGNMTCYIRNPLTGEEKRTNIILAGDLFYPDHIWMIFSVSLLFVILFLTIVLSCQCFTKGYNCCKKCGVIKGISLNVMLFPYDCHGCLRPSVIQLLTCLFWTAYYISGVPETSLYFRSFVSLVQ